jgi:hypothetical protein
LIWGLGCFTGLLFAITLVFAADFSAYHQRQNFIDTTVTGTQIVESPSRCHAFAPSLVASHGCVIVANAESLGVLDAIYWAFGNLTPVQTGIQPVSTEARVLVFGEMLAAAFVLIAFGGVFLAIVKL